MQDLLICGDGNEKAEASGKQTHKNPWSTGNEICQICGFWWVTPAHDHHFIITILTTVMQHWNCTTFILLRREESGKGRGDLQQAKILNTSSSNFKLLEKLENPWSVPLGGESPGFTPLEKSAGLLPRGESLIDFSHVIFLPLVSIHKRVETNWG